jgi:membrane-associated protein
MEIIAKIIDILLHLNVYLPLWADAMGPWFYILIFAVVFCETGLVVTPFLPGDSLLFAIGAIAALPGSPVSPVTAMIVLLAAAVLGDSVNYEIGRLLGVKVFTAENSRFFKKKYLDQTHAFYQKHGGKTIILARFIPIIRTFAPFVAGIGTMSYRRFLSYNVIGAFIWVVSFTMAGYLFSDLPVVQNHFHLVIVAIIIISCIPGVIAYFQAKREEKQKQSA